MKIIRFKDQNGNIHETAFFKGVKGARGDSGSGSGSGGGVSDVTVDGASVVDDGIAEIDLTGKVDKVTGKQLSTEDYTAAEKSKLAGVEAGAEVNVQSDWSQADSAADDYIKNKPTIPPAVTVDSALSSTSENPVQNKVINTALGNKADGNGRVFIGTCDTAASEHYKVVTCDEYDSYKPGDILVVKFANANNITSLYMRVGTLASYAINVMDNGDIVPIQSWNAGQVRDTRIFVLSRYTGSGSLYWLMIGTDTTYSNATQSTKGLMSAADKIKLDGIASGATEDDHKWNDVELAHSDYATDIGTASDYHGYLALIGGVIGGAAPNKDSTSAKLLKVSTFSSEVNSVPARDKDGYMWSQTPSNGDSSNKVATTQFVDRAVSAKQDTLVSGTNIKTINNQSLLGSGNISISGGSGGGGTSDYDQLSNRPQVNSNILTGNKSLSDLGLAGEVLDTFYPVGSYYETSDTTFDPNTAWGGTWVLETEGQVHVSAGTDYPVAGAPTDTSDGGSANAIVPYHRHSVSITSEHGTSHSHGAGTDYRFMRTQGTLGRENVSKGSTTTQKYVYATDVVGYTTNTASESSHTHSVSGKTAYTGKNADGTTPSSDNRTGANMPPYIAVNRWHRTA